MGDLENVYLYNLDDLQRVVAETQAGRRESVTDAERIVAAAVDEYVAAHRARAAGADDRRPVQAVAPAGPGRGRPDAGQVRATDAERQQPDELARRIVNKLLHDPVTALRRADAAHGPRAVRPRLEQLFRLPGEDTVDRRREPPA